jgi:hypothetical protein
MLGASKGRPGLIEFWRGRFARNADARFEAEEVIVSGNRATVLSEYTHRARHRREIPPGSALVWPCNLRASYRLIRASRDHVRANLLQVTLRRLHSEPRSMHYEKAQLDLPLADSARLLNLGCALMQTTTHDSLYRSFQFRAWAGYLEDGTGSTRPFTSATIRFIALSNFSA